MLFLLPPNDKAGYQARRVASTRDLGKDTISTELQPLREVLKLINSWFGSRLLCNAYLTLDTVTYEVEILEFLLY